MTMPAHITGRMLAALAAHSRGGVLLGSANARLGPVLRAHADGHRGLVQRGDSGWGRLGRSWKIGVGSSGIPIFDLRCPIWDPGADF